MFQIVCHSPSNTISLTFFFEYKHIYEAGYDRLFIMYLKVLWKMEHLLFWSKCSIFHNIFKSIQNLSFSWIFQCCLKIENDVMI